MIDELAEYSVDGQTIAHGKHSGTLTLTSPAPHKATSDTAIRRLLRQELAAGKLPPAGENSLYFIYLPPGVTVTLGGGRSCTAFCGYHNADGDVFYAVMPYPGCEACAGSLAVFEALTTTSSHELCEAITDPVPGEGWYDDQNGEIADICAWQTKQLGGYTVQLEWSNKLGACM